MHQESPTCVCSVCRERRAAKRFDSVMRKLDKLQLCLNDCQIVLLWSWAEGSSPEPSSWELEQWVAGRV